MYGAGFSDRSVRYRHPHQQRINVRTCEGTSGADKPADFVRRSCAFLASRFACALSAPPLVIVADCSSLISRVGDAARCCHRASLVRFVVRHLGRARRNSAVDVRPRYRIQPATGRARIISVDRPHDGRMHQLAPKIAERSGSRISFNT
jgi:hypothetical protein